MKNASLIVLLSFAIITLCACSPVTVKNSAFDGSKIITMSQKSISGNGSMSISLYSDSSLPKNKSLAKLYISGHHKANAKTTINIVVNHKTFKLQPIDSEKQSDIRSNTNLMNGKVTTNSYNSLVIDFYIPDEAIKLISEYRNTFNDFKNKNKPAFMVQLDNSKIEEEINHFALRSPFEQFYSAKYNIN